MDLFFGGKLEQLLEENKMFNQTRKKQAYMPNMVYGWIVNPSFIIRRHIYLEIHKLINSQSFSSQSVILDYGCGSSPYKPLFGANKYIRLDISDGSHDHSDEEIDIFFDGKIIPLDDNSVDFVIMTEVIEHLFEPAEALLEIARVLKPDGKILITAPFCWEEHEIPFDYARYTSYGLTKLLKDASFLPIINIKTGNYIDVIGQLFSTAIYNFFKSNVLRRIVHLTIRAFITILFYSAARLAPIKQVDAQRMYLNNIILSKISK